MPTAVALAPLPQFFDNAGDPLTGGKIDFYVAGTLTRQDTYTDRNAGTTNANPVVLDASGRTPGIWLILNMPYDIVVTDSSGNPMGSVQNFYGGADPAQLVVAGIVPATGGTYTGLVNLNGGALFGGTAAQDLATLDSLGISSVQNSNLWINSDFAINQRGAVSAGDGVYGFDHVVSLCDTGSVSLAQIAQPQDGIPYAMRTLQPDASPKRVGFLQIIEAKNCLSLRGKSISFSARLRCSVATTVRMALVAWTGTADSPTRDVVNNWASTTYTAGNFFVANTLPIAVAATALAANTYTDITVSSTSAGGVVVPSTATNLYMVVWTDAAVVQNVQLDASLMQCGKGTSAQLWTPPDAQVELARCQRYYQIGTAVFSGYGTVAAVLSNRVSYLASMRIIPTITLVGAGYSNASGGVAASVTTTDFTLQYIIAAAGVGTISTGFNAYAEF